jgi:nickel/cobalt transporter (NicO) family protein
MILLVVSAVFIGLVHSLAPGHWLPVVFLTRARRWSMGTAMLGALVAASGHVLVSVFLGVLGIKIGVHYFTQYEEQIEHYSGLVLVVFGIVYALLAYFNHIGCSSHTHHHGPEPRKHSEPFLFLFSMGLTPCVAVLPIFAAAAPLGTLTLVITMLGFALGAVVALLGTTVLVSFGVMRLEYPFLEHYGDVITGICVALMGILIFSLPH